ncbi:MAG: hypothetical protein NC097_04510 [Clostridium sp.]|nr:hypothetical protein [Prevotella sp.]MCM1429040.1 hypothetical protein [Clostridium sp.]
MAKIKQAGISEIHWNLPPQWGEGDTAYKRLCQLLKEDAKFFAPVKTGPKDYFWNHPEGGWSPLSSADVGTATIVRTKLEALRSHLEQKVPTYAAKLLTVPNDDYIFYRVDAIGQTEILLTGWGYSNYKKATGGASKKVTQDVPMMNVRIGFAVEGLPQPGRPFETFTANGMTNNFLTDAQGWFSLKGMKIGQSQQVKDSISGKVVTLTWSSGQSEYLIDVTQTMRLQVNVQKDGRPLPLGEATAVIDGESIPIRIDNGSGVIERTWHPEMAANVTFGNETREVDVLKAMPTVNYVDFMQESPAVAPPDLPVDEPLPPEIPEDLPPEIPKKDISVAVLDTAGRPLASAGITLRQEGPGVGLPIEGRLDRDGKITFPADKFAPGRDIITSVAMPARNLPVIRWQLEQNETEYVLQELRDSGGNIFGEIAAAFGCILGAALFCWGIVNFGEYLNSLLYF